MLLFRLRILILMILTVMISRMQKRFSWPLFPTKVLTLNLEGTPSNTYLNDMENQSVHAMQDFEQTQVMDFIDNEIHSDININVLLTMMNSMSLIGESVNMDRKRNESCDKCFNLDAELLKSQNAHNDLLKKYFENNDLKAQLQDNDTTICKLKEIIKSMREKSKEENVNYDYCEIETKNVELENSDYIKHWFETANTLVRSVVVGTKKVLKEKGLAHSPELIPMKNTNNLMNHTKNKIIMAAPTIHVSAEENLRDPIDIKVDIIHPEPVAVVAFLAAVVVRIQAQHGDAIQGIQEHLLGVPIQEELTG
ncbi:hypothetical protein Tco_1491381 [Tanacetum coccineum]